MREAAATAPDRKEVIPLDQEAQDFTAPASDEAIEPDVIEMTDDEGNTILFEIIDYFFYNGEEYAILTEAEDGDNAEQSADAQCAPDDESEEQEEIDCYIMKVVSTTDEHGEELEEFVPVEDQALEAKLMQIASTRLNADDDPDDEA